MEIPFYQVDAFAREPFAGNPAAVCLLPEWPADAVMQNIAAENNLSETAFLVRKDGRLCLRWFTPVCEINLCGHATLATGWVAFHRLGVQGGRVEFESAEGLVAVERDGDRLALDFPAWPGRSRTRESMPDLAPALGMQPIDMLASRSWMAVFSAEAEVRGLRPDMVKLAALGRSVIVTAPGDHADFVSRFFAPGMGIPEDPVTGSAHCTLIPYWAKVLHKSKLFALQVSRRGGELFCEDAGARVRIGGHAALFLEGKITL